MHRTSHTGASLQGQWFPPHFPPWKSHHSITGWSNSTIALMWLNEVYLPETRPKGSKWRLLILDEHSTHVTTEFMYIAFKNHVRLLYSPPHTSHKTQPLDWCVFSAVKEYFRQETKPLAVFTPSTPANKRRFLQAYVKASGQGMRVRNIISGFRKTGIWTYNPAAILEDPEAILNDGTRPATPPDGSQPIQKSPPTATRTPKGS